ncbi:uncharacterized protein LOC119582118 [Penaeus monodon]|uniref:uncharacterized protein LOC119582118 n=1 Tax=Penaeus monodon TaxID=6687 RepID=UPI0018A70B87|nr:uncharacterized protein LOC119582118 [Penaeus monodon]
MVLLLSRDENPSCQRRGPDSLKTSLSKFSFQSSPHCQQLGLKSSRMVCVSFTTDTALDKLTVSSSDPVERLTSSVTDHHCCFGTATCANKFQGRRPYKSPVRPSFLLVCKDRDSLHHRRRDFVFSITHRSRIEDDPG